MADKPVEFYNGTNIFVLPNGDTYLGEYCAHVKGVIWREGEGVYQTADGQFYEGQWKDDKLVDGDVVITYQDKSVYNGLLKKNKYDGPGSYTLENGLKFFLNCSSNKPVGEVKMADLDGRLWHGVVDKDRVQLTPENIFYKNIEKNRGKSKKFLKSLEPEWKPTPPPSESSFQACVLSDKDFETMVFAQSTKIDEVIDYTDSDWYRRFAQYKTRRTIVLEKVKNHQQLDKAEAVWYMNYARYKKHKKDESIKKSMLGKTKVDTSLLEKFFSQEYADSCKPYSVMYPTYNWQMPPESDHRFIPLVAEEDVSSAEVESVGVEADLPPLEQPVSEKEEPPEEPSRTSVGVTTGSLYAYLDAIAGKKEQGKATGKEQENAAEDDDNFCK